MPLWTYGDFEQTDKVLTFALDLRDYVDFIYTIKYEDFFKDITKQSLSIAQRFIYVAECETMRGFQNPLYYATPLFWRRNNADEMWRLLEMTHTCQDGIEQIRRIKSHHYNDAKIDLVKSGAFKTCF